MTKKEAERSIHHIAKENGTTEQEVRNEMMIAIRAAMNNPDPKVQEQWKHFRFEGTEPTPEEFMIYVAQRVENL